MPRSKIGRPAASGARNRRGRRREEPSDNRLERRPAPSQTLSYISRWTARIVARRTFSASAEDKSAIVSTGRSRPSASSIGPKLRGRVGAKPRLLRAHECAERVVVESLLLESHRAGDSPDVFERLLPDPFLEYVVESARHSRDQQKIAEKRAEDLSERAQLRIDFSGFDAREVRLRQAGPFGELRLSHVQSGPRRSDHRVRGQASGGRRVRRERADPVERPAVGKGQDPRPSHALF